MTQRRKEELKLVEAQFGELELAPDLDWLIIKKWKLVQGWNMSETPVLILVPSGYPVTPPDNFYTDPNLRLAGGGQPGNTSGAAAAGRQWLQFSYHVEPSDWQPHADILRGHNLLTFLDGVRRRLLEVN